MEPNLLLKLIQMFKDRVSLKISSWFNVRSWSKKLVCALIKMKYCLETTSCRRGSNSWLSYLSRLPQTRYASFIWGSRTKLDTPYLSGIGTFLKIWSERSYLKNFLLISDAELLAFRAMAACISFWSSKSRKEKQWWIAFLLLSTQSFRTRVINIVSQGSTR